ncbi:MAG: PSP1 domain-containing protein [Planctomycetota bacterium]|jgi:cell fate regulator YaaT (PSP1 superfamily)
MSIVPLPVFEADADPRHRRAMSDEEVYQQLEPPKTIVVRYGSMKLVAELPHDGDAKPGCGSKLVARTQRGTEVVEMLTTTCENAGCSKSVTRKEMRDYIDNSGGREFPFHNEGRILRVATIDDLNKQSALMGRKTEYVRTCKQLISELNLAMTLVDVEPILGEELLTFYFMAQERVDFRELVRKLAAEFKTRIEMRQVGARDEARLVADYERCGQHCCCKNFLKVLKPISMKAAKLQKATLDPLKISGRCGRLMCCLRYEDQSYRELKKKLPPRNSRVGTTEGPGVVVDSKILVQLVLVTLEEEGRVIAVPVEELLDPETCPRPGEAQKAEAPAPDPMRGLKPEQVKERADDRQRSRRGGRRRRKSAQQDAYRKQAQEQEAEGAKSEAAPLKSESAPEKPAEDGEGAAAKPKRRRRRRRRRGRGPKPSS